MRVQDLRGALHLAEQLLDVSSFRDVELVLLPGLAQLLSSDVAVYHHVDLRPGNLEEIDVFWPAASFRPHMHSYNRVMHEHPFVRTFTTDLPAAPVLITDYLSQREWRPSPVYAESHRALGADHQMSHVLAHRHLAVRAVTVARRRPAYAHRERELLSAVTPHLVRALCRAYGQVTGYTAQRVVPRVEPVVLRPADPVLHLAGPGAPSRLTAREAEVLRLVACGLTNRQVGVRLAIADATVAKHLERVYEKLDVDNRVAAVQALSSSRG